MSRFEQAIAAIDAANAQDPNREQIDGVERPRELVYGQRMSARILRFAPDAPESIRLAARAQHICRWEIPRTNFPTGRTGYLKWRTQLYGHHAERAARILERVGYDAETVERVGSLVRKQRLRSDPEVQLLEDVACLVFLEHYFHDFAAKHSTEKLHDILRKTWRKMSERGRAAALKLPLAPDDFALIKTALDSA